MLFPLANVKKRSVRDPDGEMAVVPKLLHGRTALKLVGQAIEVFDGYLGRQRSEYDPRALEAILSDYRLARCIEACLLTRYSFVQPSFADLLSPDKVAGMESRGLSTPTDLRLALWDRVNAELGGFALPESREAMLASLARDWELPEDPALVERLLSLDSEGVAVLTRKGERPGPREVLIQYNRGAVQTLVAHSTRVELRVSRLPGAALKRLYFVAKRRGILVEVEEAPGGYSLTLFGPEQAFGTPEKYGLRLADVTFSLLRSLLGSEAEAHVEATAYLMLHERPYRFHLTEDILGRLEFQPRPDTDSKRRIAEAGVAYSVGSTVEDGLSSSEEPSFDSLVEAALYKEHKALEKGGYTHGWGIEREPDPLLAHGIVLIPDFAFSRAGTRVFMEIAGFWSPGYRERKVSKLRSLASQSGHDTALIIAAPNDAVQIFSELPYPVVAYKNKVRATDIIAVLDERYGERESRREVAASRFDSLRAQATERGFMPEPEIAQSLQAYTRSELLATAPELESAGLTYLPGVGLISQPVIDRLEILLKEALESSGGKLDLDRASEIVESALSAHADIESLVQLWPPWRIDRPSLFEAYFVGEE